MYGRPGDFFFHYTTRDAAFAHILPEGRLRLSPYSKMRDPMEAKAPALGAGLYVPDDPAIEQAMQQSYLEAQIRIGTLRSHTKLLSLTVDARGYEGPDEIFGRGWARARMWEQYAEKHAGVCLLFRRDAFHDLVLAQLKESSPGAKSGPVRYTKTGLVADAASTLLLDAAVGGAELAETHLQRHLEAFFFLKLVDWESEHEYRFILPSEDETYSFVDFGDTLAAVMVGSNFPDWQIRGALARCQQAGAEALQLSWEHLNRPLPLRLLPADSS